MNKKLVFSLVLTTLFVGVAIAQSQDYTPAPLQEYGAPLDEYGAPPQTPGNVVEKIPAGPSDWILYRHCADCCGPVGGHGPILTELYLRTGVSVPFGGGVYGDLLGVGWAVQGGGRVLFYDEPMQQAWFIDTSILNIWNPERNRNTQVPLSVLVPGGLNPITGQPDSVRVNFGEDGIPAVTVRDLNRTFVNLGVGRLWHMGNLWSGAGRPWRFGIDAGGRYGSGRGRFVELQSRSDTIYGAYLGAQADLEFPCGCCVFTTGLRTEYSYTWTDPILQSQNNGEFSEINLMLHFGVNY